MSKQTGFLKLWDLGRIFRKKHNNNSSMNQKD